jgi:uncharacterized protein (DUF488 family)
MLYSIGHGTRKTDDFLRLLKNHGIEFLIDVRSIPHSRFNPQYNQKTLKSFLEENTIRYVFMGDTLGGRPKDPSCYVNGKISYEALRNTSFFKTGLERLKTAYVKGIPVAIMCSERKPENCHRSRLIANVLHEEGIAIKHIDELDGIKDHIELKGQFHI